MYFDFPNPIEVAAIKAYHNDPYRELNSDGEEVYTQEELSSMAQKEAKRQRLSSVDEDEDNLYEGGSKNAKDSKRK